MSEGLRDQPPPPSNGQNVTRMPPQAVEVEKAVLGAMLIDQAAIGRALEILDQSSFYHAPHGRIFTAMLTLYENNEAVDQLTVAEELRRRRPGFFREDHTPVPRPQPWDRLSVKGSGGKARN